MNKLSINKTGLVVGILSTILFVICTAWGNLFLAVELKTLHFQLLQMAYPGFDYTAIGYIIGLVEAYIYGWVVGALFAWLCKKVCVTKECCGQCK